MEEEINRVLWESKRQMAIKRLQELREGEHFCVVTQDPEKHAVGKVTAAGCIFWMLETAQTISEMVVDRMTGQEDDTKIKDN